MKSPQEIRCFDPQCAHLNVEKERLALVTQCQELEHTETKMRLAGHEGWPRFKDKQPEKMKQRRQRVTRESGTRGRSASVVWAAALADSGMEIVQDLEKMRTNYDLLSELRWPETQEKQRRLYLCLRASTTGPADGVVKNMVMHGFVSWHHKSTTPARHGLHNGAPAYHEP